MSGSNGPALETQTPTGAAGQTASQVEVTLALRFHCKPAKTLAHLSCFLQRNGWAWKNFVYVDRHSQSFIFICFQAYGHIIIIID